jgi:hypothetical protein
MSKHMGVAVVLILLAGASLCGQVCPTQSYLVSRGTAESARNAIVQTIDGAARSLDIAVSSFADGGIGDAVVRAVQRGVSVRVVLPVSARTEAEGQYRRLTTSGIPLKLVPASRTFSHRFAVVDGATVITGSYEWAGGTNQASYGTLTVIRCGSGAADTSRAGEFAADFARLWDSLPGEQATAQPTSAPSISMEIAIQEVDCEAQCVLLFNPSTEAASLAGWVLTDSEGRYVFPAESQLAPGELYRLCIGALNPADTFLLYFDCEHDEVYLIAPDGTLVDQVVW